MVDKRFTLSQCTLVFRSRLSMASISDVSANPATGCCFPFRIFLSHLSIPGFAEDVYYYHCFI